jgi:phytol kinase
MNQDFLNAILLGVSFLLLFGIGELMFHYFKVKVELTRKFSHAGTGLLTLLFPLLLGSHWLVLFLCSSFAVILLLSMKYGFLKSINAIDRDSVGSIAYPVSVYLCYLAFEHYQYHYYYFYMPVLILAFCDPLAALAGKKWPWGRYRVGKDYKTLLGSGAFFVSAFFLQLVVLFLLGFDSLNSRVLLVSIVVALLACLAEAFSKRGFDNLSIPLCVLLTLMLINHLYGPPYGVSAHFAGR